MRSVVAVISLGIAGAGCSRESPSNGGGAPFTGRPNVLLISLDTARADALTPWGAPADRTPGLAKLAAEGVVFETAISPAPLTLPAHATMFTGLDPSRHSVRDNSTFALPGTATTLAETLNGAGWRTFAAVASVILLPRFGLDQGFERYDAEGLSASADAAHERHAEAVVDATLPQLRGAEPFFGFVHLYDPHRPYRAPAEIEKKFGDPYVAEIHFADRALGRLFQHLRAEGWAERTIVVFTADHGEGRGDHGESTHGMLLHEATQRVPLIVRGPGLAPRRVSGIVATLADVMPTVLELCGVAPPAELDGRSLVAALRGGEMEAGDAYLESFYPRRAFDFAPLYGVRTAEWKLVVGARPHLWHLANDPRETKEVGSDHGDVVTALTRRALHLRDGRGEALPVAESSLSREERRVLGGMGYVAGGGGELAEPDASSRPDPYDDIAAAEDASLATLLSEEGKDGLAIAKLEPLVRRYPGVAHVRQLLGALYGRQGEHGKALDELLAAAKLRPGSPDLEIQVATAAWFSQKHDLVKQHLETATKLPDCPARAFLMLADAYISEKNGKGARETLLKMIQRTDLTSEERTQAAMALQKLGN